MTVEEFYAALESHDWFYTMADDGRAFRRGEANEQKLRAITEGNPSLVNLYNDYKAYKHLANRPNRPPKPNLSDY